MGGGRGAQFIAVGSATSACDPGCYKKQAEQATGMNPVSRVHPSPLLQSQVPALTSLPDELIWNSQLQETLSSSSSFRLWFFVTATETPTETESQLHWKLKRVICEQRPQSPAVYRGCRSQTATFEQCLLRGKAEPTHAWICIGKGCWLSWMFSV